MAELTISKEKLGEGPWLVLQACGEGHKSRIATTVEYLFPILQRVHPYMETTFRSRDPIVIFCLKSEESKGKEQDEKTLYNVVEKISENIGLRFTVNTLYVCRDVSESKSDIMREISQFYEESCKDRKVRLHIHPRKSQEDWGIAIEEDQTIKLDLQPKLFMYVITVVQLTSSCYLYCVDTPRSKFFGELPLIRQHEHDKHTCRAYFKMAEISQLFNISYSSSWNCIDIGAAPGGWTEFIAPRVKHCYSIDPGQLKESVLDLKNVTHLRQTLEVALPDLRSALGNAKIALCVCDINQLPGIAMKLIQQILPLLQSSVVVIVTLKFTKRKQLQCDNLDKELRNIKETLPDFDCQMIWLLSNSSFERTVIATRSVVSPV